VSIKSGKQYAYLTALFPTKDRCGCKGIIWVCGCRCGNSVLVSAKVLSARRKKSCGCVYVINTGPNTDPYNRFTLMMDGVVV